MRKKILSIIGIISLVLGNISITYAVLEENREKTAEFMRLEQKDTSLKSTQTLKTSDYAPGQLIVKFKPALGNQAGKLFKEGKVFKSITGTDTLDNLNQKHKVRKVERVFKDLEVKGKYKGKDFITASEEAEEIKAKFSQRAKRTPKAAKIPDLENIYLLEIEDPKADILTIAEEYQKDPSVAYAEPNYKAEVMMVPNDPYYSSSNSWGQGYDDLWGLKPNKLNCEAAWDITQGEGIIVAVIDTGIDYNHEDLAANIWINMDEIPNNGIDDDHNGYVDDTRGYDFIGIDYQTPVLDNNPIDGHGHGTHAAGTIAAIGNNGKGVIGVAPKAKVMAVKGLDDVGKGMALGLGNSIKYAANNGADVLSNSWGGSASQQLITDAVNYAYAQGCVVIAAAGNSNTDAMFFTPANLPNVITIGASNQDDLRCYFSNYGSKIDVVAPGGNGESNVRNILSLLSANSYFAQNYTQNIIGSKYLRLAGTSMACPHAAGAAALILAHQPSFANEEVRQILRASTDDVGTPNFDLQTGFGRINASKAILIDSALRVKITTPAPGSDLDPRVGSITVTGTAAGANFKQYQLSYASTSNMGNWIPIGSTIPNPVESGYLGSWDISGLSGSYVLRLLATTYSGFQFEDIVQVYKEQYSFTRITTNSASQYNPAISGDKIIWEDNRNIYTSSWDIYMYDLTSNTERRITSNSATQNYPAISGNKIAWEDRRNSNNLDIYLYDLSTNTERRITSDSTSQRYPAISGDKIVGQDYRSDHWGNIYLYDLSTNTERQITTDPMAQWQPAISGDKIVWEDYRYGSIDPAGGPYGNSEIYLYDLSTNTERRITNNSAPQLQPDISGDKIVWEDKRNGNWDIYLYDLSTNTERRITSSPATQRRPVISGDKIVWHDDRNSNWDIYLYDLSTNTERRITSNPATQAYPFISGNRIVWEDYRSGNADIYMYDLNAEQDTTLPTTPVVTDEGSTTARTDQLYASWTASDPESGIAEYQYRITQDSTSGAVIKDWTSTGTTSYVTAGGLSLINGKSYYFAVKAKNGAGRWSNVGYSDGITVVVVTPPVAPSGLVATAVSASQINLSWLDNSTNETGFKIERSLDGVSFSQITTVGANVISYSNTGLAASTTYYYRVRAYNTGGDSGYSNTASATTQSTDPGIINAPTGLTAAISGTTIILRWQDNSSNEEGFYIERGTKAKGVTTYARIATVGANVTTYSYTASKGTYYYRVQAFNTTTGRTSGYSNAVSARVR